MNDKHNAKVSEPIIKELLEKLGEGWEVNCCLNDSCASIHKEFEEHEWVSIYVPNALKEDASNEEYNTFSMTVFEEYYPQYKTVDEVVEALKYGVYDLIHELEAIELRAKQESN